VTDDPDVDDLDTILDAAVALLDNGQSTNMTLIAVDRLSRGLRRPVAVIPAWSSLTVCEPSPGGRVRIAGTRPVGINMRRVVAVMHAVDEAEDRPLDGNALRVAVADAQRLPGSSALAFTAAAAAGAGALSVVFGATDVRVVVGAAMAAGLGGVVRRILGRFRGGPLIQVFFAALIAGIAGAVAMRVGLGDAATLVALCPAMVLVPGPQVLIAAMDILALRISIGISRTCYATLILVTIAAGLVVGLEAGGRALPLSSPAAHVPFLVDVLSAGLAAACYPVFFSTPYRLLGWPVAAGMAAHALHWWSMVAWHLGAPVAALVACLFVGFTLAPVAYRHRIPFTAIGFAAVVAMVPGVYVFRAVAGLLQFAGAPTPSLLADSAACGITALLIVACMAVGLTIPIQVRDALVERRVGPRPASA
jgi:uncharacterized membrane protein YjjP (DUF1212 family)